MKILIPKEHGAWAMWIAPFIIGILVTRFQWQHLFLLIAVFFFYISISPFLQGIRKKEDRNRLWKHSFSYLSIAVLLGIPLIILHPKIVYIVLGIIPLFLINIFYTIRKNERALLNDLAAIGSLNSIFFAAYFLGSNQFNNESFIIWLMIFLFFLGSTLYVKSIYRERDNASFKLFAKVYMVFLPLVGFFVYGIPLLIAYLFSSIRVFFAKPHLKPKQVGIVEIFNTIWFILAFAFLL